MKTLCSFAFLFLVSITTLYSQSLPRSAIVASAMESESAGINISVTFGQAGIVGNLEKNDISLLVGFQQPDGESYTTTIDVWLDYKLDIYPNPFRDKFSILISGNEDQNYTFSLHSVTGQKVSLSGQGKVGETKTINGAFLPPGLYILSVSLDDMTRTDRLLLTY